MVARQVRRSVVMSNLQIRLLPMDSDRTPLEKGKDVLHGAARAAPLRQSVEQPWSRPRPLVRPPLTGRGERIRLIEGIPLDDLASQSPGSVRLLRLVAREQGFGSHAGGATAASP